MCVCGGGGGVELTPEPLWIRHCLLCTGALRTTSDGKLLTKLDGKS